MDIKCLVCVGYLSSAGTFQASGHISAARTLPETNLNLEVRSDRGGQKEQRKEEDKEHGEKNEDAESRFVSLFNT